MKKNFIIILVVVFTSTLTGCIKETYDLNKLSEQAHLSPELVSSAVTGEITFGDILKENDTIIYDDDKLCRIIYRKDSVIDLRLKDYYNFDNMVSYDETTKVGDARISDFQTSLNVSLSQMSLLFSASLRTQLAGYDDGALHPFPPLPAISMGNLSLSPVIANLDYATFASGSFEVSVENRLNTSLNGVRIRLFNSTGLSPAGNEVVLSPVPAGATVTGSINMAGLYVTKSLVANVTFDGSPGNTTPVLIGMEQSIILTVRGKDLKVRSGRIILPPQLIDEGVRKDTITIDPGEGVEIDKLKVRTGSLTYRLQSTSNIKTSFTVTLKDAIRGGNPVTKTVILSPKSVENGVVNLDNTAFDLTGDVKQKFNRVPAEYVIIISSDNNMIDFNSQDNIRCELYLNDPSMDYVKGYFGQKIETIPAKILDLDMQDIFKKISGDFSISNPVARVNYSNSFGLPVEVKLNALGIKAATNVALSRDAFTILFPDSLPSRDTSATVLIDKTNSKISELVSMLPEEVRFSGTARMNPQGDDKTRGNYVFEESRLLAGVEVDIPMELKISNLQFADTVDNFLDTEEADNNQPVKPEDFEFVRIELKATNWFPLGVSVQMNLYDSKRKQIVNSVEAKDILKPAPVDAGGKVTGSSETIAGIEFKEEFFKSVNKADKIIFKFIMRSTDNGVKDVKIYSDYKLIFNAAAVIKPDIKL